MIIWALTVLPRDMQAFSGCDKFHNVLFVCFLKSGVNLAVLHFLSWHTAVTVDSNKKGRLLQPEITFHSDSSITAIEVVNKWEDMELLKALSFLQERELW